MKRGKTTILKDKSARVNKRISFSIRGKMVIGFVSIIVLLMAVWGRMSIVDTKPLHDASNPA